MADIFNNDHFLAIYTKAARDAVIEAAGKVPEKCELAADGGRSEFEKLLHAYLKGSHSYAAEGIFSELIHVAKNESAEGWLSHLEWLSKSSGANMPMPVKYYIDIPALPDKVKDRVVSAALSVASAISNALVVANEGVFEGDAESLALIEADLDSLAEAVDLVFSHSSTTRPDDFN